MTAMISKLARKRKLRIAGMMSGTSADGIDVAIVDVTDRHIDLVAYHTVPYTRLLRRDIFRLFDHDTARVDDLCHLNFAVGEAFASAVLHVADRCAVPLESIDLIGSHGQTVCHLPGGRRSGRRKLRSTLQIGEPSVIAERTGITTVADFRTRDVAAGGHGAPLVPLADYLLVHHRTLSRAVQNIGGIANVTWLPADCAVYDIIAFDTGPGNMVIDAVVQAVTGGQAKYDPNGEIAAAGDMDRKLLTRLMRHRYLKKRPPKTTGREEFGRAFVESLLTDARDRRLSDEDLLATVTAFTARSIARAYRDFLPASPDEVVICGGGAHNATLLTMLADELSGIRIVLIDELGINTDAKEAVSFALLARQTILGLPGNVPSATGAHHPVVLGKIIPAYNPLKE